jgi:hypothetical protein
LERHHARPATVYAPFPVVLGTALVCGLPLSATTTEEFGLLERTAPAERLTEGIAYLLSVNSLGAALGALAAARLLPTRGGVAVLWLGAAALALSAAIVTAFLGAAARPAEG